MSVDVPHTCTWGVEPDDLVCTFCRKTRREVKQLVAGPGVYICDECVSLCNGLMAADEPAPPAPPLTLNDLRDLCYASAKAHGFYDIGLRNLGEQLMLIVTELAEAMEEVRLKPREGLRVGLSDPEGKPCGFPSEIADVFIRLFDLCGSLGIDIEAAVDAKMAYNLNRSYKHGGKSA